MAAIKIAQLTNQTTLNDTDTVIVETATSTNKMTVGKLKELLGIQAGGVAESGTNEFGKYIKYHDGTMICYGVISGTFSSESPLGTGGYYGSTLNVNLPAEFINTGYVVDTTPTSLNFVGFRAALSTKGVFSVRPLSTSTYSNQTLSSGYIAVGRWK